MPESCSIPGYLENHQSVVDVYGKWPIFHDSEVVSLSMDRVGILFGAIHNPRIELVILSFDLISTPDSKEVSSVKHTLVHFGFDNVSEVKLEGFNHQNALYDLQFQEMPLDPAGNPSFRVILNAALGLGGEFIAASGKVISIRRCDKTGKEMEQPS
jgi:Immunity protein 50